MLFLAEAFTRPAMMRTLGKIGFHQSYTYFAWRNTKQELIDYMVELSQDTAHVLRPTFWPTTHDIMAGRVKASARKRTSGCSAWIWRRSRCQKVSGLVWGLSTRKMVTPRPIQVFTTSRIAA